MTATWYPAGDGDEWLVTEDGRLLAIAPAGMFPTNLVVKL